jgi:cobaltochelatase CobN
VGANPALYHLDSTAPAALKIRSLAQEIARALRGRAANPRWLQGQMRHGHRGAAEIAQSLDNLYCFAALTDAVASEQFDLMFDATIGDDDVRAFLVSANRKAASHMASLFDEAARRGFWLSRRNSSARIVASVLKEAA